MPNPRPSAWALVGVLLASVLSANIPVASAADSAFGTIMTADPSEVCSPGEGPTNSRDDVHPPATIRVLRSKGPNAGHVETVDFWKYVGVVVRAEYSTGQDKPPLWMRVGALTVKQYGWFKAAWWQGGRVTFTDESGVVTSTECFDVKDTTADQIYKPEKWDSTTGTWIEGNVPSPANLRAMRETWHLTLRKWVADKNKSRFFLTGYRSGKQQPCGADATGFKIMQKSLRDCGVKGLNLEETLRQYFEPSLLIVDTRKHDALADANAWRGDLAVVTPGNGIMNWRLYDLSGQQHGNNADANGSVGVSSVIASAVANVDSVDSNGAADAKLLADLILVTGNSVQVARATGNGFGSTLVTTSFSGGAPSKAVVGDFNGDLLADVALVRGGAVQVMTAKGDGTFSEPVVWWASTIDLDASSMFVAAGDVNGDGKADVIVRDATGNFQTAVSAASCSDLSVWGPCPTAAIGSTELGGAGLALSAPPSIAGAKLVVGDYDRDGRDDVIGVLASTGKVFGLHANKDGTFADPQQLWSGASSVISGQPVALDITPDGMADLAIVQVGMIQWLRTNERSSVPASMTTMSSVSDNQITSASKGV